MDAADANFRGRAFAGKFRIVLESAMHSHTARGRARREDRECALPGKGECLRRRYPPGPH